jgi:siderophore synthetase component
MNSLERAAVDATFKSFANCYLKEIDAGRVTQLSPELDKKSVVEWQLPAQQVTIRAELNYVSLCGPQSFGEITWCQKAAVHDVQRQWHQLDPLLAVHLLLNEAYHRCGAAETSAQQLELLSGILDSCQNMLRFAEVADKAPADPFSFIEAEQSLVFGHWQHPTPKSQHGYTRKAQAIYAPELRGHFQLDYFAAKRGVIDEQSSLDLSASALMLEACDVAFECLVPLHPLQASVLREEEDVQVLIAEGNLRYLGRGGRFFRATSSMRTLYSEDSDWMLKFSLPIRLTNSVRLNLREELEAGVAMSRLLRESHMLEGCGS